jgi:hypothetical protein
MVAPDTARLTNDSARRRAGLRLGWVAVGLATAYAAHALTITNVAVVNVTPSAFAIVFQTSESATTHVSIYADAAAGSALAGLVGVEAVPLHSGPPDLIDAYARRQRLTVIRQTVRQHRLGYVRVSGCQPGTRYYYRIAAASPNGENAVWPAAGPLPGVTTARETAFVPQAKQLVIELTGDTEGQLVTLRSTNCAYALAAVTGDGAAPNQAVFNLADLLALAGEVNYIPIGPQQFLAAIHGLTPPGAENPFEVDFSQQFQVGALVQTAYGQDFLALELGTAVVAAGESGELPISLRAGLGVAALSFTLNLPTNRLVNLALAPVAPEIDTASIETLAPERVRLRLATAAGQTIAGARSLAQLRFTAAAMQSSAFLPLQPLNLEAHKADGSGVVTLLTVGGRITVVADQPLLEATRQSDGTRGLLLYGKPGTIYQLQQAASLVPPVQWNNTVRVPLNRLVELVSPLSPTPNPMFVRAMELVTDPPLLDARRQPDGTGRLILYGLPGHAYQLQYATNLSGVVSWHPYQSYTLTNSVRVVDGVTLTNPVLVFRMLRL